MEELFFINTGSVQSPRRIFVHALFNDSKSGVFVLFFNPFLDRIAAFSTQSNQVEIARALHAKGINTIHFDYYGTGDSGGELYEIDFRKTVDEDIPEMIRYIKAKYAVSSIVLFGIRLGADIALHISQSYSDLNNLILYEPVVNGNSFYKEKKYIVKANHLLWNINPETEITINGASYEDFDGVPFSEQTRSFIRSIRSDELTLTNKNILLFNIMSANLNEKLDSISNKRHISSFVSNQNKTNRIREVALDLSEGQQAMTSKTTGWIVKFVTLIESMSAVETTLPIETKTT